MCSLLYYYYSDPPFPHNEAVLVLYQQSNDNPHIVLKGEKYQELSKIIPVQCSMTHRSPTQPTVNELNSAAERHGTLARIQRCA